MAVVPPTDCPKSVRNRCILEFLVAFLCCQLVFESSVCIRGFVIGLSQIFSFFLMYSCRVPCERFDSSVIIPFSWCVVAVTLPPYIPFVVLRAFMAGAASQAVDANSSRAHGLTSGLQGSVNIHRTNSKLKRRGHKNIAQTSKLIKIVYQIYIKTSTKVGYAPTG